MRNHPKKGSPEAFAWARRMQAARKRIPKRNPGAAYHEAEAVAEHLHAHGRADVQDLRVAAYIVSIGRVAATYQSKGL